MENIPEERKLFIRLEDMEGQLNKLFDFLDLEQKPNLNVKRHNAVRKSDAQKYLTEKQFNYDYFNREGFQMVESKMKEWGYQK